MDVLSKHVVCVLGDVCKLFDKMIFVEKYMLETKRYQELLEGFACLEART
jgi:hypothetical protein